MKMSLFLLGSEHMNLESFALDLDRTIRRLRGGLELNARDYKWRVAQLQALKRMLIENDTRINAALWADLRKSHFECVATEQGVVLAEIADALKNLHSWMKPRSVSTPIYNLPGSCKIVHDPLGLTLIIGAWNYPINVTLAPLVGAIAGGNGAILKPSELAAKTAELLGELIPKYLDPQLFAVVEGGPQETSLLLDHAFDKIFFTGSTPIGKIVMTKAAQHLTPLVLELGGKSPALVLDDADLKVTARRLAWGKFMNAGQTCVAPDYILVQRGLKDRLVEELKSNIQSAYGHEIQSSPDYCRIINRRNLDRLAKLLHGEKILVGGKVDFDDLYVEPTLIEANLSSPIMQDEIFGPILPILEVDGLDEMISIVNARPKPLALYLFSSSRERQALVLARTSSGGVCVNDVVMHMPVPELPFGGVGASGMGHYHGEYSFKAFTHAKGVLRKSTWIDIPIRYAPYSLRNLKILRWLF
jgi:aldehyde dehydrogenase (NAD+)